ncbi:MAG: alpha/beta hydrolase [Alphaproteobacteria bacterium]
MASAEHQQVEQMITNLFTMGQQGESAPGEPDPDGQIATRNMLEAAAQPASAFPEVTITEGVDAGGVQAEWVVANEGADTSRRLLYIHGGGFFMGSPRTHRPITTSLAKESGCAVLAIDYRMMPENPRLAGVEDCNAAWDWMLENGPEGASTASATFVGGDSAGGNLTLSLIVALNGSARRQADAAIAIAPLTDGRMVNESLTANAPRDAMLGGSIGALEGVPHEQRIELQAASWGVPADDPRVSPIHGELAGLPPILVHASQSECLYDDARLFTEKANAAGVDIRLDARPDLMHVWHNFAPVVPEAVEALAEIGAFVKSK